MNMGTLQGGDFPEQSWDFGDDLGRGGCVVDGLLPPENSGGCGTIALERSMGIGIWRGPSEVDVMVEILREEFSEVVSGLNLLETNDFTGYLLRNMAWDRQNLDPEDPELRSSLERVVTDLQRDGSLRKLAEEWILRHRRLW